ncbi:MAG: DNA metabolism protein [Verrucomicrobia bacterium]|nr:MAG: DNA metabolism protein [Verrucomicrobiota bacterium]TAE87692.1 MAG: DNA metabolism protein [Verrucomicrobiota bacterium]TAF25374.1 MAG: DNA metabolism protein [Verrucomicrobiota bacterium]TAF41161.1 MAG: DNA metabolism protein [Verrucomicrobiota bacterium]
MRRVDPGDGFESWREAARGLLAEGVPPGEVIWEAGPQTSLFDSPASSPGKPLRGTVPPAFLELARLVACHRDPRRWSILYRLLWRILQPDGRRLLELASDPDLAQARTMEKNVRREIHKMHAFVRFRKTGEDESGRERFVAWFEPEHFIVEAAAPFFRKRFANMDWSIFTPHGCVHWLGGVAKSSPGVESDPCDDRDAMEAVWRTYYRSIFNPARLKLKAMSAEMPKRYWKNLPEAELIEELGRASGSRVDSMLATPGRVPRGLPRNAYLESLHRLADPE